MTWYDYDLLIHRWWIESISWQHIYIYYIVYIRVYIYIVVFIDITSKSFLHQVYSSHSACSIHINFTHPDLGKTTIVNSISVSAIICPDVFVFISILQNKHFYSDFWSMNGIDWVYPSNLRLVPGASSLSTLGTGICPKYWECLMICPTDVHQYFPGSLFYRKQSGDHRGLQEYHGLYMNRNKRSRATFWFSSTGCKILRSSMLSHQVNFPTGFLKN